MAVAEKILRLLMSLQKVFHPKYLEKIKNKAHTLSNTDSGYFNHNMVKSLYI